MALRNRNKPRSLGTHHANLSGENTPPAGSPRRAASITKRGEIGNPQSRNFKVPPQLESGNPRSLVLYLFALQRQRFGETALVHLDARTQTSHMKNLVRKYGVEMTVRGITYAAQVAEYPFTIKLVTDVIKQLQEQHE